MASVADSCQEIEVKIQLSDIIFYASGGSRLVVEGERVYQANNLLLVGVQEVFNDGLSIFASCLKSSSPNSEPHKIIMRTKRAFEDWSIRCSCKAGMGKCKHAMAVLNYLSLHSSVPLLSQTDLQQKWGKIAQRVAADKYKATKVSDFCCSGKDRRSTDVPLKRISLSPLETTSIRKSFLQNIPDCSLYYEVYGRPQQAENSEKRPQHSRIVEDLLNISAQSNTNRRSSLDSIISVDESSEMIVLKSFLENSLCSDKYSTADYENMHFIGPLEENLGVFYELQVCVSTRESIQICCDTIEQRLSKSWKIERSRRITASNAYGLHTYYSSFDKPKDWRKKIISVAASQKMRNPLIDHGVRCEPLAIKSYTQDFGKVVTKCGFVIPPHIPWLGCSPDGIVLDERKIIEVKCPFVGKNHVLADTLEQLSYLSKNSKRLKINHSYYAQIQLNMFILKCKTTDFIIYSEFEDKCSVQTIMYDENYLRKILGSLKEVYFNAFLKFLCTAISVSPACA
ncbi:uncharacterized protein LOC129728678 [Wyeomyia smithii]|uniref:uncharacterized protein LOC129728678 n=1 Tax=Wyeomyia smithii TaxID=174621 RepID=UPI002467ED86|nr:uncharacterized protein LOC129728678 [Wyeomyia smithii]